MDKIFFENLKIKIIQDEVISTKEVGKGSIDLVVTSPPYNLDIQSLFFISTISSSLWPEINFFLLNL